MSSPSNQVHVPEQSSYEQNESANISVPILTLPTTRFNKNSVHRPSFGADGANAAVITDLSPPLSGEGTSSASPATSLIPPPVDVGVVTNPVVPAPNNSSIGDATITVAAPPMAEEDEEQIAAPLIPFPFPCVRTAERGSDQDRLEALVIMVKPNEDIIKSLVNVAKEKGFFILGASGMVSYVELLNQEDAPVENTALQGLFEIITLDGNIVIPKNNGNNQENWLTVLVAGKDFAVRGGPARRLIAGSNVQIVVGTISPSMESLARQQYWRRPELLHFPNYRNRDWLTTEVVNQIHKVTLKELNNETTNTPSAGDVIFA